MIENRQKLLNIMFILEPDSAEPTLRERSAPSYPNVGVANEMAKQSMPVGVMVIVYGLTTLCQIAFYLIPVQLPFFLDNLVKALPSQSGMAIALCTLFSAIASIPYDKLKQRMEFVTFLPVIFGPMGIGYLLIVTQPWTKTLGLGGTYALTGGILVTVALGFAVFKSQVRNLTRSRAI